MLRLFVKDRHISCIHIISAKKQNFTCREGTTSENMQKTRFKLYKTVLCNNKGHKFI